MSDTELCLALATERESELTNVYSPLSLRIKKLIANLEKQNFEERKNANLYPKN